MHFLDVDRGRIRHRRHAPRAVPSRPAPPEVGSRRTTANELGACIAFEWAVQSPTKCVQTECGLDVNSDLGRSSRSPWAGPAQAHSVAITPPERPYEAEIAVPGSKSFTNRALLIAALAKGRSMLTGVLKSDDSYWLIDALKRLGVSVEMDGETVIIDGCGGVWPKTSGELFLGSAGTSARFLPGALAAAPSGAWLVDGSDQLRGRPIAPLFAALRQLGAHINPLHGDESLPMEIKGGGLQGGVVSISGKVSSQFLSGLLIAAPYASGPVTLRLTDDLVQPAYIGITINLMKEFGADVEHRPDYREIYVRPRRYQGRALTLEADASSACYFLALPALAPGRVRVTNVGTASLQPDAAFVDVLEAMGVIVHRTPGSLATESPAGGLAKLRGGHTFDMKPMSDQALTLGVLAAFADAPVTVTNVGHIRKHESDRISVLSQNLSRMGVTVDEREDAFTVHPGSMRGALIDPHDDHRNAMSFSLAGTRISGVRILDPGCVSKTFPTFFDVLRQVGVGVSFTWQDS